MTRIALATLLLVLVLSACDSGFDGEAPASSTPADEFTTLPSVIPGTEPAAHIAVPEGFSTYAVATGFFRPTSIALADDGTVFISQRHGTVERIADADGDGIFESKKTFVETSGEITGLLVAPGGGLYVSRTGSLVLFQDTDGDGAADSSEEIVSDLPNGRHQNNGLTIGPDGKLYITNGTTCDDCDEEDSRSGAILRANPDGSDVRVFATGLRNSYDLAFDQQGRLWATDNGSDEPCATVDELNVIIEGGDYGWPYGEDGCDPLSDGIIPAASLGLHTAATGIDSYEAGQFPMDYRGTLFITLWGSFFAEPERPPQLLRATIEDSTRATVQTFAKGFQHPIDVVVDRDGTLLVLDYGEDGENDTPGTLYRIVYTG